MKKIFGIAIVTFIGGLLIALLGWNFNRLLTMGIGDLFVSIGITNEYWQVVAIIVALLIILLIIGFSAKKILKSISGE